MASVEQAPSIPSIVPTVRRQAAVIAAAEKRTCAHCAHWNELDPDTSDIFADGNYDVGEEGTGQCRRYPPSSRSADWRPEIPHKMMDSGDAAGSAYWPITFDADWCGEFVGCQTGIGI